MMRLVHQVNLRCPRCAYYAKTTRGMLRRARLKCPLHPAEVLETPSERNEQRGRPMKRAA